MEESERIHWAEQYAEKIIENRKKDLYIVESGITPSGVVHAGNFREYLTHDQIYKSLKAKGVNVMHQMVWDNFDRLRKVPAGVPKEWEQYLGLPTSKVPDPFGNCHKSYAHHFQDFAEQEAARLGLEMEYIDITEKYEACEFTEEIKIALENTAKIKTILDKYRKDPLEEDWLPIRVYCEKCGKDFTKARYLGGYELQYACDQCGNSNKIDFRKSGNVKLSWRVDWPARWKHYSVDFESSGKEHQSSGGSMSTGLEIYKEVYHGEDFQHPMYEFISMKGEQGKMSSSKGNVLTISEMLEVYSPEVLKYVYTGKISKALEIPFDLDLPNTFNRYDNAEQIYFGVKEGDENEKTRYVMTMKTIPKKFIPKVQYLVCANVIQSANYDINKAIEILKKLGHVHNENEEHTRQRLILAGNWVKKYAPDNIKFTLQETLPQVELTKQHKELLGYVAGLLEKGLPEDDLQNEIYSKAKALEIPAKEAFQKFYQLLLNENRGPKLGSFLASLDRDFAIKRLRLEA